MANGKIMQAIVNIGGGIDESLGSAIERAVKNLDKISKSAEDSAGAVEKLSDKIQDQEKTLADAQRRYASYILAGEESSDQAQELADTIKSLSRELGSNKRALDAAEQAAENLGKSARDTKDGFTIMKGAIANLVATGITRLIDTATNAVTSLYGLSESTREYREDIGKLESAWEAAGKSTELATDTYKNFYSVLGEEDRSVEAVNHLAKFVDTEKDMSRWTDIATGVWATFGDSLPIEGLTEASNETAKVGKITGVLADALNWAGVNEDQFQAQLDAASTEQERAALITETLSGLYDDAADKYRENNASIIEARLATSDYTDSMAELGERMEPVTTAVTNGLNGILQKALELTSRVDWVAVSEGVAGGMEKVADMMQFVADHADILIPLVVTLTGAFVTYKAITAAAAAVEGIKTAALIASTAATTAASVATWSLNSALAVLTSPITLVIAAIVALVAAGIALYKNWDTVKEKAAAVWNWITAGFGKMKDAVTGFLSGIGDTFQNVFSSFVGMAKTPINAVISLINKAINGINGIGIDIPDWVPGLGGKSFSLNIPEIPMLASGGFTRGVSIAGEAGTEAVISFDPAYRDANLSYWARAGRLLGATADDMDFSLSGSSSGGTTIDFGGVTFAPNIQVSGNANKQTIMEAIEDAFPEFEDLLDRVAEKRRRTVWQT